MTYATKQDMIDRFGTPELVTLTDREEFSTGEIVDGVLNAALSEADAEINSYLAKQVATPIDPVPAKIKRLACDIARYRLCKEMPPEIVRTAYKDAISWLHRAALGQVSLGQDVGPTAPASAGTPMIDTGGRTFSNDTLQDFR